jgi:hypothetical protein
LGFRPDATGAHELAFADKASMLKALLIVSSDLFFEYWMTTGDGFHVTKSDLLEFPITNKLSSVLESKLAMADKMWRRRSRFGKEKLNAGVVTRSFDFSGQVDLIPLVC